MKGFFLFWWRVIWRSLWDSLRLIVPHGVTEAIRNGAITLAPFAAAYFAGPYLVRDHLMSVDNVQDTATWIGLGLAGLGAIWLTLFFIHVLFITPYRMWVDTSERQIESKGAMLPPPSASEISELRAEVAGYYDRLLNEIGATAEMRRKGLLTPQEFDSRMTTFNARNGSYAAILLHNEVLRETATMVKNGARRRELPLTTVRMGNYFAEGPFLSTSHATLVATINNQRSELIGLLDEALRSTGSSAITRPSSPGFNFRLHHPRDNSGQFVSLVAVPKIGTTGVVVIGGYATEQNGEWHWSIPARMAQRESLLPSESLSLPLVERAWLKDNQDDHIKVVGQELSHRERDAAQGDIVLVKVVVSTDSGLSEFKKLYNFRRAHNRQFIDALDLEAHSFIKDNGSMA